MPPFRAFSTNCSWAICEFRSVLGAGWSAGRLKPPPLRRSRDGAGTELAVVPSAGEAWAQAKLPHNAAAKTAPIQRIKLAVRFLFGVTIRNGFTFQSARRRRLPGGRRLLRLSDHSIKRRLRLVVAIEQERLAIGAPRNGIVHTPERHHLHGVAVLEERPEDSRVCVGLPSVGVSH